MLHADLDYLTGCCFFGGGGFFWGGRIWGGGVEGGFLFSLSAPCMKHRPTCKLTSNK